MKIAIHHRPGSFSERWIEYCQKNSISYKIVDAFDNDIIQQVKDCNAFMWHHHHGQFKDVLTAKRILFALEQASIKVFPDFNTGWHFDDKIAQKYLLEAINAPLVPSYVFYDKEDALAWAKETTYPKVFKLKGGAGAKNVRLIKTYKEAKKIIYQAFTKGFPQFDKWGNFKESLNNFRNDHSNIEGLIKGTGRLIITPEFSKLESNEIGYVYFQDFIPNNNFDIRVIIINDKAFAVERMVRPNDFRASGSGNINYNLDNINIDIIKTAFKVNHKLKSQSIAFDFIIDSNNNPLVIEISYGYSVVAYDACLGYWDSNLNWHSGSFNPQEWIIEDLISSLKEQ